MEEMRSWKEPLALQVSELHCFSCTRIPLVDLCSLLESQQDNSLCCLAP